MARNAEKAMTALARWRRMKLEEERGPELRRPNRATDVMDVKGISRLDLSLSSSHKSSEADKWRRDVIREVAKKISQIQNPGLGEYRIRDLNDEINKLLKHKLMWEVRVKELGGPDHSKTAPKMEGREVPGNRGYKYFGAAKDLPGVRELFEQAPPDMTRKTRAELMRDIDADYYGYMDDDDGILIPLEMEAEHKARSEAISSWKQKKESAMQSGEGTSSRILEDEDPDIYNIQDDDSDEEGVSALKRVEYDEEGKPKYIAHVPVPTQKDIEEALLRRKKMELLEKYASDSLVEQSEKAKALLGFELAASSTGNATDSATGANVQSMET